jgi:putative transposase
MNMLLVNDVYQCGQSSFRILWRDINFAYWIDINDRSALPKLISIENLIKLLQDDDIHFIADPYEQFLIAPPSKTTDWGKKVQTIAWEMISNYVKQEPEIYNRSERGKFVQSIIAEHSTTKQTVYAKLRAYWQLGKSPNALYPDTSKNGGAGKTKSAGEKKRGRPRTVSLGTGINIDEHVGNVFRTIIKAYYLNTTGNTLQFAYTRALIALGIDPKKAFDAQFAEAPTYDQFYHFAQKEIGAVEKARKRAGEVQYNKDFRPVLGTSAAGVMGPGSLYQIDATIGDVYLVSENDRTKIIGRPVIYIVIDVFSRLVTGVYIGLEGPSWVSAMSALANTMIDKVAFCAKYDIHIEQDEWPVVGRPEAILGDKGEMFGRTVEIMSEALYIDIQNTPSYRADWKGIVERHFRTLQETFKPYVEGYVTGIISKKRAGPDYRLDAELTLRDISKIIIHCILEYNNSHVVSNYDPDKDMPPELPHNPLALWNWGIQNRTGKLRNISEDLATVNLLPHKEATITNEGIKLFGCLYSTSIAISEGWFHRIDSGPKKVLVAYDPHITNRIYLRPEGKFNQIIVCDLTERSREYRDLTFWDVWRINKIKATTAATARLKKTKGQLSLDGWIKQVTSEARKQKPDTSMESKTSQTKGIRDNRSNEISEQRQLNPGLMPQAPIKNDTGNQGVNPKDQKSQSFNIPDMLDDLYGG